MMAVEVKRKVRDIQKPAGYHVMRLRQKKIPTDLTSTKHLRLAIETQRTLLPCLGCGWRKTSTNLPTHHGTETSCKHLNALLRPQGLDRGGHLVACQPCGCLQQEPLQYTSVWLKNGRKREVKQFENCEERWNCKCEGEEQ